MAELLHADLGGILDQPGYLSWFLLAGALAFMGSARSSFARIGAAAGLGFVCALGILGPLSLLLWLNCPGEFTSVFEVAYDLRILPVMAPLITAAAFIWFVDFREDHPRLGRAALGVVVVLIPWTLVEHGRDIVCAGAYRRDAAYTADHYRTENTVLQRYSWDLMLVPRFFSNGVMDPALESRFWRKGDPAHALIDPDRIERALEAPAASIFFQRSSQSQLDLRTNRGTDFGDQRLVLVHRIAVVLRFEQQIGTSVAFGDIAGDPSLCNSAPRCVCLGTVGQVEINIAESAGRLLIVARRFVGAAQGKFEVAAHRRAIFLSSAAALSAARSSLSSASAYTRSASRTSSESGKFLLKSASVESASAL